jgi:hypothetical protein
MSKLGRNQISSWPLKIINADGAEELYNTYADYVKYSGRKITSKENIAYRFKRTRLKGNYQGEQWILINYKKYQETFLSKKTFTCDKCKNERDLSYYDIIDAKMSKNFHKVEFDDRVEKHCLPCMQEWAREIINSPPLVPRTKTLQDYRNEILEQKREKQKLKNKRCRNGHSNTNKG